jgi:SAM-dependent methyltransferase
MSEGDGVKPSELVSRALQDFNRLNIPITDDDQINKASPPFNVSRGLEKNGAVVGYMDLLPTYNGKTFIELVDQEIEKRKLDSSGFRKIKIIDAGYGEGNFLLECRKRWGDQVELIGFGTDIYTKTSVRMTDKSDGNLVQSPANEEALRNANIQLVGGGIDREGNVTGNIIDIRKELGDNFADFIVSTNTLAYVGYPNWEIIKKCYRVLDRGGVALIEDIYFDPYATADFETYLSKQGYSFELGRGTISFRKTHPDITVPVRTDRSSLQPTQDRPLNYYYGIQKLIIPKK